MVLSWVREVQTWLLENATAVALQFVATVLGFVLGFLLRKGRGRFEMGVAVAIATLFGALSFGRHAFLATSSAIVLGMIYGKRKDEYLGFILSLHPSGLLKANTF